jgi:tRNA (cmo5U34)-methyltransferase
MQEIERDQIFTRQAAGSRDFRFDTETARVFDDMVSRSVPFYHEIQRMTAELANDFATDGTNLFDLGCSTGTTLIELDQVVQADTCFIGIDNSDEMLEKAERKMSQASLRHRYELRRADLHNGMEIENASVVLMVLTLQFVRPLYRSRVIRSIAQGMNEQGCLILVEKHTPEDSHLNRLFISHYYDMKRRNGYSDLEIAQKREALENVLIPYRMEENRELLLSEGFRTCEEFFRWYNFAGLVALK